MTDERDRGPHDADTPAPAGGAASPGQPAVDPATEAAPGPGAEPVPESDGVAATSADETPANEAPANEIPANETSRQRRKREKAAKPRRKAPWWELPVLVLVAIGIAILVKTFVVQPFYIPSESMEKTLHGCQGCSGDRILVNKPIYSVLRDPEPGDIVVFNAPKGWDRETVSEPPSNPIVKVVRGFGQLVGFVPPDGEVLVKRVIATGGQTVKGDAQGHVMISTKGPDGPYRTLDEPYVYAPANEGGREQTPFGPVTVPKDRLWVMGDHRTASADSRYHCRRGEESTDADSACDPVFSTVPVDNVIGKAFVIAWPVSRWDILGTPNTFENASASAAPALASLAATVPVFVVRRRRRTGRRR